MSQIRVIVVSPEEAYDGTAEFWCGAELMGITMLSQSGLQLRIDSRTDGQPWVNRHDQPRARPRRSEPTDRRVLRAGGAGAVDLRRVV
jgi:hypothetical protein